MKDYKKLLKEGLCSIKFKKTNGDIREIKQATTNSDYLPVREESKSETKIRKPNDEILTFFSVEDAGWRSCRLDTIINFESN